MKSKSLCVALALLCIACNKKTEYLSDKNELCLDILSEPMACSSAPLPPMKEIVKFSPPKINDEEGENNGNSSNKKEEDKKIIRDGYLSIKVNNVESSKHQIDTILKKFGAYYEREDLKNNDDLSYYNLKIRVPSKKFEFLLKVAEGGCGEVIEKNIETRDVTEDYYDSEIRLNSKRMFRNRYNDLLTKAVKVEDMLSIEENLRMVQEEIESQEGHLKFINDQVLYSTLNIHLFHSNEISEQKTEETFVQRTKQSLKNGWDSVIRFFLWIILQWPWFIIAIITFFIIKRMVKRGKK